MSWWGYAGMGLGALVFWLLLVGGIVALIRFLVGDQVGQPTVETPSVEEILASRFARGEIGETEYRDRLAVLRERTLH